MNGHDLRQIDSIDEVKAIASHSSKLEVCNIVRALLYDPREKFRELGIYLYITRL